MGNQFGFIDIILLAMFAGFIILRLRNILGRRTGHQGKNNKTYFSRGMGVLKDIENNDAIRSGNIDENVKKQFLKGAEIAYEQIITSFAKGDKKSLKPLLEKEMYKRRNQQKRSRKKEAEDLEKRRRSAKKGRSPDRSTAARETFLGKTDVGGGLTEVQAALLMRGDTRTGGRTGETCGRRLRWARRLRGGCGGGGGRREQP